MSRAKVNFSKTDWLLHDLEIARQLNCHRSTVRAARKQLGFPVVRMNRTKNRDRQVCLICKKLLVLGENCSLRAKITKSYKCTRCNVELARKYQERHPERAQEKQRERRLANPEKAREVQKKYYQKYSKTLKYQEHHIERLKSIKEEGKRLRNECLLAYGGYRCRCCGETCKEFLSLDHIYRNGNKDRKIHGTGLRFYRYLKNSGFPPGLQVLCFNCNMARAFYYLCPHDKEKLDGNGYTKERPPFCSMGSVYKDEAARGED